MIRAPLAPWVMAVHAREIDKGCRCAPRRPRRAHRRGDGSCCAQQSCASLSRAAGAAGFTRTGLGATPQSEGLVRVRGQARLRTPGPDPWGRSQTSDPLREGLQPLFRAWLRPTAEPVAAGNASRTQNEM